MDQPLSRSNRTRLKFSLRMLLVGTAAVSLIAAVYGHRYRAVVQRDKAVESLQRFPGRVLYDYEMDGHDDPPGSTWARQWLGDRYFAEVGDICLRADESFDDETMAVVQRFSKLRKLLVSRTAVTDEGLKRLVGMEDLTVLALSQSKVTDDGMRYVGRLHQLEFLGLTDTQITDEGLRRLHGLGQLRRLFLRGTRVTEAGRKEFLDAVPQCEVYLD